MDAKFLLLFASYQSLLATNMDAKFFRPRREPFVGLFVVHLMVYLIWILQKTPWMKSALCFVVQLKNIRWGMTPICNKFWDDPHRGTKNVSP